MIQIKYQKEIAIFMLSFTGGGLVFSNSITTALALLIGVVTIAFLLMALLANTGAIQTNTDNIETIAAELKRIRSQRIRETDLEHVSVFHKRQAI